MEDEETHGLPQGGGDALHTRRTTPIVRGDEGSASTRGAKTSATAPNTLKSNGTTEMTNASVEESTSTKGASGTADATNPKNSVSDYVDALTTLALMPRAVRACSSFLFSFTCGSRSFRRLFFTFRVCTRPDNQTMRAFASYVLVRAPKRHPRCFVRASDGDARRCYTLFPVKSGTLLQAHPRRVFARSRCPCPRHCFSDGGGGWSEPG